jgi:hypothetical protein
MPKTRKVSIFRELGAYFEMVEIGKEMMISSLTEQGLTPLEAKIEFARLHKERFLRGDPPDLVQRAMKAGVWRRT